MLILTISLPRNWFWIISIGLITLCTYVQVCQCKRKRGNQWNVAFILKSVEMHHPLLWRLTVDVQRSTTFHVIKYHFLSFSNNVLQLPWFFSLSRVKSFSLVVVQFGYSDICQDWWGILQFDGKWQWMYLGKMTSKYWVFFKIFKADRKSLSFFLCIFG